MIIHLVLVVSWILNISKPSFEYALEVSITRVWHMPENPAFGKQRQEGYPFEVLYGYNVSPCLTETKWESKMGWREEMVISLYFMRCRKRLHKGLGRKKKNLE